MTEEATGDRERAARPTMNEVDHTHPHTDAPFGDNGVYDRGPEDGDESETAEATADDDAEDDDGVPVRTDGGSGYADVQPEWAVQRPPDERNR